MRRIACILIFILLPLFVFAQEIIEKIEVIGNERVTRDTILYYITSQEGGIYDRELLRKDFRVLWSTGFFSNIKIEESKGRKGKVVKIIVEENPVIRNITYKTRKKLKQDDIVNKLKEKDEYVLPYSYYSPYKIQRIKSTIEDLLVEKGLPSGKVSVKEERIGKNEIDVIFDINEGPKIRVAQVEFTGKVKVPESALREAMKENKKHDLYSWITKKDIFKQNKLEEDLANIKKKLQEYGYMEAVVGEPRIEEVKRRTLFLKKQKMKKIIIPIDAGYRYSVGEIKIEGNKSVSTKYLQTLIKIKKGEIYNTKLREKSVEEMGEVYRNGGFLYAHIVPVENLDPKRKLVNVTFNINEGDVCFVRRIEFKGNTYTKDKVLRRELLLREGMVFMLEVFKNSLLRMNQLGLVEVKEDPDIKPAPDDPTQFDVTIKVQELQRNNIQFSAGYSGYEGYFVAASYSTVNFMGAGEKLDLMVQYGKRIKNILVGFSEPYLFDRPITFGFNVYHRNIILPYLYTRKGTGADLTLGARIKGYTRASFTYNYEYVNIALPESESPIPINPYYFGVGNYHVSSILPTLYRSTIDSPLTPSRGWMFLASCKYAGTFLGGEIHLYKPLFEFTFFKPLFKGHVIGAHIEYQFVKRLREDSLVPFWEKIYLGGERSIRGYQIYSIGPRDEKGRNIGGVKALVFNAEYIIKVGGPVYAIFFFDAGNAYGEEEKVSLRDIYMSTGLEMRVFVPALRVPFRLIFAFNNPKIFPGDSNFAFRFAVGTTF